MQRNLYLTTIPVEQAQEIYKKALGSILSPVPETISVTDAAGRITAEAVYARFSSPLYNSAAMDGIAVISARTAWASEASPVLLRPEDYMVVDTGDPIRKPYDAVIMAEDIQETPEGILIRSSAPAWQHVRPIGEDIVAGEMILTGFHKIRPIDIGVLLSGGVTKISVFAQPRVGIIPTGTEIIEPCDNPAQGDIIESNSRMFEAMIREKGCIPLRYDIVRDDREAIRESVLKALEENDIVIVNAGSSAGTEDYTVHILREIGEVFVHGVAMKPGKPVILGKACGKPVIGIPGYPVSAYLAMENFVYPLLDERCGRRMPEERTAIQAVLSRRLVSSLKHREYVRVRVGRVGGRYVCAPLARGAGAAMSMVRADGFCVIPQEKEGYEAGETVTVSLLGSTEDLDRTLVCIGSHDLLLDILSDLMSGEPEGIRLSSTHIGSLGGLMALRRAEAHLAPAHLLDEKTGVYNESFVRSMFPGENMVLVKSVKRIQGLMVAAGNPLGIRGIEDLTRVRFVNRQRGAGTRVLLDYKLKQAGIPTESIHGYETEAATHMAVAAQVSGGEADCGMGVYSAARAMGLGFIPVGEEEYDFVMRGESLEMPEVKCFLRLLGSEAFRSKLEELGGYLPETPVRIVRIS